MKNVTSENTKLVEKNQDSQFSMKTYSAGEIRVFFSTKSDSARLKLPKCATLDIRKCWKIQVLSADKNRFFDHFRKNGKISQEWK